MNGTRVPDGNLDGHARPNYPVTGQLLPKTANYVTVAVQRNNSNYNSVKDIPQEMVPTPEACQQFVNQASPKHTIHPEDHPALFCGSINVNPQSVPNTTAIQSYVSPPYVSRTVSAHGSSKQTNYQSNQTITSPNAVMIAPNQMRPLTPMVSSYASVVSNGSVNGFPGNVAPTYNVGLRHHLRMNRPVNVYMLPQNSEKPSSLNASVQQSPQQSVTAPYAPVVYNEKFSQLSSSLPDPSPAIEDVPKSQYNSKDNYKNSCKTSDRHAACLQPNKPSKQARSSEGKVSSKKAETSRHESNIDLNVSARPNSLAAPNAKEYVSNNSSCLQLPEQSTKNIKVSGNQDNLLKERKSCNTRVSQKLVSMNNGAQKVLSSSSQNSVATSGNGFLGPFPSNNPQVGRERTVLSKYSSNKSIGQSSKLSWEERSIENHRASLKRNGSKTKTGQLSQSNYRVSIKHEVVSSYCRLFLPWFNLQMLIFPSCRWKESLRRLTQLL